MSILWKSQDSFLLDHRCFTRLTFHRAKLQGSHSKVGNFVYKQEYFQIKAPHITPAVEKSTRKRAKKRKHPTNDEETASKEYHSTVAPHLQNVVEDLKEKILQLEKLSENDQQYLTTGNQCSTCSKLFQDLCFRTVFDNDEIRILSENPIHIEYQNITERLVTYQGNQPRTICIGNENYLFPPNSSFLLSDITKLEPLILASLKNSGFDIVVIDPPWENKSAKRGKKYSWLTLEDILKLPLNQLMSEKCLIFVWVTNKQKIHNFVKSKFFPTHGVEFVTEWHWIKITSNGQPVFDFSSPHKKPYETIIVGKTKDFNIEIPSIVVCSVPCTVHSHKPPLCEVFKKCLPFLPERPKCLELFARNLTPDWTSWGNEVLEFQNSKHFESGHQRK